MSAIREETVGAKVMRSLLPFGVRESVVRNGFALYCHYRLERLFFALLGAFSAHCLADGGMGLCQSREDMCEARSDLAEDEVLDTALRAMLLLDAIAFELALLQPSGSVDQGEIPF